MSANRPKYSRRRAELVREKKKCMATKYDDLAVSTFPVRLQKPGLTRRPIWDNERAEHGQLARSLSLSPPLAILSTSKEKPTGSLLLVCLLDKT